MIKIRTISYNLPEIMTAEDYSKIKKSVERWKQCSFGVRTQRLTLPIQDPVADAERFKGLAEFAESAGIRWFNIPFSSWGQGKADYSAIPQILRKYPGAFCNVICAKDGQVKEEIVQEIIRTIRNIADIKEDGSTNFRFGASMNVQPNGPFFPFTYASGDKLSFSVGLEMAEEINDILAKNQIDDLNQLYQHIMQRLEPQIIEVERQIEENANDIGIDFAGIDFSLAPLPQKNSSIITILKEIGISDINHTGVMFATAYLTRLLKTFAKKHKSVGFSGVMYSLLEDYEYARLNDIQEISIDRMISLSTMCGCGVDMVPVDYASSDVDLRGILCEVACISSRLSKPLGVRILLVKNNVYNRTNISSDDDFIVNTSLVNINSSNNLMRYSIVLNLNMP